MNDPTIKRIIIEGLNRARTSKLEIGMPVRKLFDKISREENIPLHIMRITAG